MFVLSSVVIIAVSNLRFYVLSDATAAHGVNNVSFLFVCFLFFGVCVCVLFFVCLFLLLLLLLLFYILCAT